MQKDYLDFKEVLLPDLTQAEGFVLGVGAKMFSCCGTRYLPASAVLLGIYRPLPLARLLPPATGGSRLAPPRRPSHRLRHGGIGGVWGCVLGDDVVLSKGPL